MAKKNDNPAELSEKEVQAARKEGAIEAEKEAAKDTHRYLTDGNLASDAEPARQWHGKDEIMHFSGLLDLSAEDLAERVDEKADNPVPEEKVAGLLELERSGRNRTDHVQVLCKRLKVKSPYEVTAAGPAYTNDQTSVTEVAR